MPNHPVKQYFDRHKKNVKKSLPLSKTFWTANDFFSLAEILSSEMLLPIRPNPNKVSILVGESDLFSVVDKLIGDTIIICDVDEVLLDFIQRQTLFLRNLYRRYLETDLSFDRVVQSYRSWLQHCSTKPSGSAMDWLDDRSIELYQFHFLFNKESYEKSMEALEEKEIITLHIDLFDLEEQVSLCEALKTNNLTVKLFNATNLPDYDTNNHLSILFSRLPWSNNPLLVWNIHDRGGLTDGQCGSYAHYLFVANSAAQYQRHVSKRPEFFADIDRTTLGEALTHVDGNSLRRYGHNNNLPQEMHHNENRQRYIQRIKANKHVNNLERVCQQYAVFRLPRTRNSSAFIISLKEAIEGSRSTIHAVYKDDSYQTLRMDANKFLDSWANKIAKCDLRSPEIQDSMKREIIVSTKSYFSFRLTDSKKHWIIKEILAIFSQIQTFGLVKRSSTGFPFFNKGTQRATTSKDKSAQPFYTSSP